MRPLLDEDVPWPAVEHLLDAALDLPAAEREPWLQALPAEHRPLQDLLRRLLQAHASAEREDSFAAPPRLAAPSASGPGGPSPGGTVGPYRLLRELGQGGMGTVWLAERNDGQLKRQVALKLPRMSWVPGLAERMARERDILATLQHPHIARLYDAGLDAQGRPYLAIEFVAGQAIDVHASQSGLDLPARLRLLLQVAAAVGYAHSRLVVHRDLKPSNILVTGDGQVRLLDFGIAKLLAADAAAGGDAADALTQVSGRALTPDYASPEQIRGDPIGTATDVYSLGVVAFELLAGQRPYRLQAGLGAAALAESLAGIDLPLASRAAMQPALQRRLQGDLDAILARALAQRPQDRYPTVQAFADDIARHLAGEPVQARAPSRLYVADRWVRRHKAETAVALALGVAAVGGAYAQVLVVLALGTGALAALWQRNRALQHADAARAATARAEQVKDFIASIFTQAVPKAGSGGAVTAADLLRAAARRVESDLAGQPAVAAELAALIGASFHELDEARDGLDWLPKAVSLCTRELGPTHRLTLQSRCHLVEAANALGRLDISESLLPALLRDLRAVQPAQVRLLCRALSSQAWVQTKHGHEAEAIAALRDVVDLTTRHFGASSDDALLACCALSNTFMHNRRPDQALPAIATAFALAQDRLGAQRPHLVLAAVERDMAAAMAASQRPREATALMRRVLADQRALDGGETPRVRVAMSFLGRSLLMCGRADEAADVLAQAAALHAQLTGGLNHEGVGTQRWLARAAILRGDGDGAMAHVLAAEQLARTLPDQGPTMQRAQDVLAAEALALAGRHADALAAIDALLGEIGPAKGPLALRLLLARTASLRGQGRVVEALAGAHAALDTAIDAECQALDHGLLLTEAARCHLLAGEAGRAAQRWRAALEVWRAGQVDGPALLASVEQALAGLPADTSA